MRCRLLGNRILTANLQKALEPSVRQIGVVGAGTMGNGIPQACAVVGISVVMTDIAQAAADRGLKTIDGSPRAAGEEGQSDGRRLPGGLACLPHRGIPGKAPPGRCDIVGGT